MPSVEPAMEIVYRLYRPGDEEAIIAFLRECGYEPDLAFWRWINRESPQSTTLIEVAEKGQRIIGHYAVLPRRLSVGGASVTAGQAIHAAVHPEFRGLAVLQGLMRRIVEASRAAGLPFLYAFPNEQIWLVYRKFFGWEDAGDIVALECPVGRSEATADTDFTVVLRDPIRFDERYQGLMPSSASDGTTHVLKDVAYLQWRYAGHPKVRYELLEAHARSGALAGYAILKRYQKGTTRYGHVVEVGLRDGVTSACRTLLAAALSLFHRQEVDTASCWLSRRSPWFAAADAMGFQSTGFATHMGYRLLDQSFPAHHLGREHWQLVMGDSDAF